MRTLISTLLAALVLSSVSPVYAAGPVKKFQVTISASVNVQEAVDITIKALDADGQTKTDYLGTVDIYSTDLQAKIPAEVESNGYTFTAADQGQKTFSKGLSFSKAGTFKVTVVDYDDEQIYGEASVTVKASSSTGATETVTLLSPDNGSTIPSSKTSVSGTTRKNARVKLFIDGTDSGKSAQTDEGGSFVFADITLTQEKNALQVKVYDGNDQVVGNSETINVTVSASGPAFTSAAFSSGDTAQIGASVGLRVMADAKLKEVTVSGTGISSTPLKEGAAGTYEGIITAPTAEGSYPVSVLLVDSLGNRTTRDAVLTLQVAPAPKSEYQNIKTVSQGDRVTLTFALTNPPSDLKSFLIEYGVAAGVLTSSATTYEATRILSGGVYSWYVPGIAPGAYFFRISALDSAKAVIANAVSSEVSVDVELNSAPTCTISNISGQKFAVGKTETTMTWDALSDATSYNIYKKSRTGEYTLVDNVKMNRYVIHLDNGAIKYEDFGLKAVCGADIGESPEYADLTKVQTGPRELFLILIALATGGLVVLVRRRMA